MRSRVSARADLQKLVDRVEQMSTPNKLRLAASLLEAKDVRLAAVIIKRAFDELSLMQLLAPVKEP
jgi:hypothetical protein